MSTKIGLVTLNYHVHAGTTTDGLRQGTTVYRELYGMGHTNSLSNETLQLRFRVPDT